MLRGSGDSPELQRYAAVKDQCPGVSAFTGKKGHQSQYRCRSRREKLLWEVTTTVRASLH